MGFFNSIFGNSKAEPAKQIRAQFKDGAFFDSMIKKKQRNLEIYSEDNEKLKSEGKLKPYNHWAIAMEYLDLVYINYSMNNNISTCYDDFLKGTDYYGIGWDADAFYADMIDMVSLGYLLNIPDEEFKKIVNYVSQSDEGSSFDDWQPDGLLWYIINAKNATGKIPEDVIYKKLYGEIFALTKLPKNEAERAMKTYLENWYALHKDDPWYDAHKKERAYRGYWCWEAGAITKIMGLDDSSYKDNPYYPYDMVHWKD
ncbi:PoNe immunity protein domain-containing protein [Mucilaginibacter lappiensis]|uniref:PoNi C-terminal domain-containing protein n=1 Tax=Mucilaginibacter lappiensis TaxID=354630 RepID=A0A841JCM3_9SPHI|nr:PoNe immunity protein domain-containing protein [Mucilaginibacter lappiensis]MBB6128374.1 hypothetical protein [Mucilaginibacter lappiensis]